MSAEIIPFAVPDAPSPPAAPSEWVWWDRADMETANMGGSSRELAIEAARRDCALDRANGDTDPQPHGFWIAPLRAATSQEERELVAEYADADDSEAAAAYAAAAFIDEDRVEHFAKCGRRQCRLAMQPGEGLFNRVTCKVYCVPCGERINQAATSKGMMPLCLTEDMLRFVQVTTAP